MQNILLVDDDEVLRTTLGGALQSAGYKASTANDGQQALEIALQSHPDLILLDYQMPNMNGVEFLRELRKDDWGKTVPIIFETNVYDVAVINEVIELGVKDYILKADMSLDSLLEMVKSYFS